MDYIRTAETLLDEMRNQSSEWDWLRRHIMPRAQAAADQDEHPVSPFRRRHSTVACESLHTFAGACMMYITPAGQKWFALKTAKKGKDKLSRYDDWFARATEITLEELAKSNFYTTMHELFLDWALTGVGCLYADKLKNGALNFIYVPTGTFSASEGLDGQPDTLARLFKLTAHQSIEQFGYDEVPQRIRDAYDDDKRRYTERHQYLHLVIPRILTLAEQVGEIDMRAGGRTVIKPQAAQLQLPREWGTQGRYDIGKDRIADKEEKIRQAYFIPFLRVISNIDRQMTATEVIARQEEQITAITPSMTLFMSECNILIHRIFSILFRMGKYPQEDMPEELIVHDQGGTENFEIKIPAVSYLGKISQAIERAQRSGGDDYIQNAIAYTQATGDPSMLQIINMRKYARFRYENTGAPIDCLYTSKELEAQDKQRAAAAQQQAQLETLQGTAKASRDLAAAQP